MVLYPIHSGFKRSHTARRRSENAPARIREETFRVIPGGGLRIRPVHKIHGPFKRGFETRSDSKPELEIGCRRPTSCQPASSGTISSSCSI